MFKINRNLLLVLASVMLAGHAFAGGQSPVLLPPPGPYISSQPWLPQPVKQPLLQGSADPYSPTAMQGSATPMSQPNAAKNAPSMPFYPHQGGWRW